MLSSVPITALESVLILSIALIASLGGILPVLTEIVFFPVAASVDIETSGYFNKSVIFCPETFYLFHLHILSFQFYPDIAKDIACVLKLPNLLSLLNQFC